MRIQDPEREEKIKKERKQKKRKKKKEMGMYDRDFRHERRALLYIPHY